MTGNLTIQRERPQLYFRPTSLDNQIGQDVPSSGSAVYQDEYVYDRDDSLTYYSQLYKTSTDRLLKNFYLRRRNASGTEITNGFNIEIDASGNPVFNFPNTAARNAFHSALGLGYAANNVFSSTGYGAAAYISNGSKSIHIYITLPKSVENITTVTATTFSGYIRGPKGYINSANTETNWLTAATSISTSIITNNIVRVSLTNSSGFTNVDNNTNLFFTGSISLKFT